MEMFAFIEKVHLKVNAFGRCRLRNSAGKLTILRVFMVFLSLQANGGIVPYTHHNFFLPLPLLFIDD
jgi:hypothetical protein